MGHRGSNRSERKKRRGQLDLKLPTWGGRRKNAGRKPSERKAGVSHLRRPDLTRDTVTHVTWRVHRDVTSLRTKDCVRTLRKCLANRCAKPAFRVAHYSIQKTHLHFVVEADSKRALASGMNGLGSSIGHMLNALFARKGRVFVDRYHVHLLKTPSEVRAALAYVLLNNTRHLAQRSIRLVQLQPDPFSSGAQFDGWKEAPDTPAHQDDVRLPRPHGWLLRLGWRRHGRISLREVPGRRAQQSCG